MSIDHRNGADVREPSGTLREARKQSFSHHAVDHHPQGPACGDQPDGFCPAVESDSAPRLSLAPQPISGASTALSEAGRIDRHQKIARQLVHFGLDRFAQARSPAFGIKQSLRRDGGILCTSRSAWSIGPIFLTAVARRRCILSASLESVTHCASTTGARLFNTRLGHVRSIGARRQRSIREKLSALAAGREMPRPSVPGGTK